jgi:putative transposase
VIKIENFRKTKTILSYIRYHIVFCTRYRRKFFINNEIAERVCILVNKKCDDLNVEVIQLLTGDSYVDLVVECPPDLSPNQLVYRIKMFCNTEELKDDFPVMEKIPNVWTRGCLISTEILDKDKIDYYVSSQKSRY